MIPFNKPYLTKHALSYVEAVQENGHLSGDGEFTARCHAWLEAATGARKALLTHSCTGALEMCAMLAGIGPGDEVIMPSFTFTSTANAFCLRGGIPVFVDIRADTHNIDENRIEAAITARTKAICVVHYAGVACNMDAIMAIADRHGLIVIEDAAQAILANYKGRPLGSIGALGAFSFHETKNITSGEGGALLINDPKLVERAELIREKGTNRSKFFRGEVDKYTWCDLGSSYLPGEVMAAFLWAQMEAATEITQRRVALWRGYQAGLKRLAAEKLLQLPVVPADCGHNGHIFYVLVPGAAERRTRFIANLRQEGIHAAFHYIPLHSSPAGRKFGRVASQLPQTDYTASRLVRLPMWLGLENHQSEVLSAVARCLPEDAQPAWPENELGVARSA